jgi:hypothetical protein
VEEIKGPVAKRLGRMLTWISVALVAGIAVEARAAEITFDLNQADAALAGTPVPYATVTVSTQGTGTATFSVVASGPYSLAEVLFEINPGVFFLAPGIAQSTGAIPFGDIGVQETSVGAAGTIDTITTDQFGGFGFGYGSQFGTVKSVKFTLTGPFINNIADVIVPNRNGFFAAAKVYDGAASGFVAGNGSPTPPVPTPEPGSLALVAVPLVAFLLCRLGRTHMKKQRLTVLAAVALADFACIPHTTCATTIDTFRFTQDGWTTVLANGTPTLISGTPVPGGLLTGSFTGIEEADGRIQLPDLTSFTAVYSDSTERAFFANSLIALYVFSFNPNAGASGLTFAASGGTGISVACTGAAASLDRLCLALQGIQNPLPTNGAVFPSTLPANPVFLGLVVTPNFPAVTLVSKVTVANPVVIPKPGSRTLVASAAGLLAIGLLGRSRRRRAHLVQRVCPCSRTTLGPDTLVPQAGLHRRTPATI